MHVVMLTHWLDTMREFAQLRIYSAWERLTSGDKRVFMHEVMGAFIATGQFVKTAVRFVVARPRATGADLDRIARISMFATELQVPLPAWAHVTSPDSWRNEMGSTW